jgi:hypothetical protein
LEDFGVVKGPILFLVGVAQEVLDRGTAISSWAARLQQLRYL